MAQWFEFVSVSWYYAPSNLRKAHPVSDPDECTETFDSHPDL
jgi:hypothetical protein